MDGPFGRRLDRTSPHYTSYASTLPPRFNTAVVFLGVFFYTTKPSLLLADANKTS